jgi:hypothetical protein
LHQDLRPVISYLPPKELELVHNAFTVSWLPRESNLNILVSEE